MIVVVVDYSIINFIYIKSIHLVFDLEIGVSEMYFEILDLFGDLGKLRCGRTDIGE